MTNPNDLVTPVLLRKENHLGTMAEFWTGGLTKREWFAGLAMQGLITFENGERLSQLFDPKKQTPDMTPKQWFANVAVSSADALIAELNKEAK